MSSFRGKHASILQLEFTTGRYILPSKKVQLLMNIATSHLLLGKVEGRKRRRRQRMRWLDGNINSMEMSVSKLQETVKDREAWRAAGHRVAKSQTWLSDWTSKILNEMELLNYCLVHLTDVKCLSHMTDTQNLITIMLHERSQPPQKSTHTSYKVPSYKILENTK